MLDADATTSGLDLRARISLRQAIGIGTNDSGVSSVSVNGATTGNHAARSPQSSTSEAVVQHAQRETVPPRARERAVHAPAARRAPADDVEQSTSPPPAREIEPEGDGSRRAWPGQQVIINKEDARLSFLRRRIESGAQLTSEQRRAAVEVGLLSRDAMPVLNDPGYDSDEVETLDELRARVEQSRVKRVRTVPSASSGGGNAATAPKDQSRSVSFAKGTAVRKPPVPRKEYEAAMARQQRGESNATDEITLSHAISRGVEKEVRRREIHVGSAKPHANASEAAQNQREDRAAPSGSLRVLEPELFEVLLAEPLPKCNIPKRTDPVDAPERLTDPPGPFTTAELLPAGVYEAVVRHGVQVKHALQRARRGEDAWKHAKSARPEALILEEHEALNPCARGYVWRKRADRDLWDAVQPSSWPEDPPQSSIKVKEFLELAKQEGLVDHELIAWVQHGFPGPQGMPNRTVIGFPHVGALKFPKEFDETNKRDIENEFVSYGHEFPEFWPCVCDPMNIVIQKGKPRATIDKTMRLASRAHPEPVESYNDHIDLDEERARVGTLSLPTTKIFSRGAAILLTCGLTVKGGKFDLSTFYRMWGKQRAAVHLSGRVLETLFGHDFRVNFGERDAPDHCCRGSDAMAFFMRRELRRLDAEYPSKAPKVLEWLALRMGLATEADDYHDPEFRWAMLFFLIYYIDDSGLAVICDGPLVNTKGEPKLEIMQRQDGSEVRVHLERPEYYFFVCMSIATRIGHLTPVKKQDAMGLRFELLGIDIDLQTQRRLLTAEKRRSYLADVRRVRKGDKRLPNGLVKVKHEDANSMVHKLNFAAEVIAGGRQHLFYLRKAVHSPNELEDSAVIIDSKADGELAWWIHQLEKSDELGVPLASRWDFPCSSESTIVRYSDASREVGNLEESGFGAWAVVRGVFVYVVDRWTADEIAKFSINVLEAKAKDVSGAIIVQYAQAMGCKVTHTMAYIDNSTAEYVAERGRTHSDPMHELNLARQQWLLDLGIYETTERVASIDNDVADLLSRGDVDEALRFPSTSGLKIKKLNIPPELRDMSELTPTWPQPSGN